MSRKTARIALLAFLLLPPALAQAARPGDLDASFGNGGIFVHAVSAYDRSPYDGAEDLLLQRDGNAIAVGNHTTGERTGWTQPAHLRVTAGGGLDGSFGTGGVARPPMPHDWWIWDGALDAEDRLVVAGDADAQATLVRYTAGGALDASFGAGGFVRTPGLYRTFTDVTPLADGKILAAGAVVEGSGRHVAAVYRFTAEGQVDTSFGDGGRILFHFGAGEGQNSAAGPMVVDPDDGTVVVLGSNAPSGGRGQIGIARLAADGSSVLTRRTVFLSAWHDWRGDTPYSLDRTDDGRFVVAAETYSGAPTLRDFAVLRFDSSLSPDGTFGQGGVVRFDVAADSDALGDLALQPDGKVVFAGNVLVEDQRKLVVVRLRADGSPDDGFGNGGASVLQFQPNGSNSVTSVAIDPKDGGIWLGGYSRRETEIYGDFTVARVLGAFPSLVAITGGPSGRAMGGDATFAFEALTEQPGRYDCRLVELAAWEPCVSPKSYRGLEDGAHRFEVRFVPDGVPVEEVRASERRWVSDSVAPTATFTRAPSGEGNPDQATFEFEAGEAEVTYRCRVDGTAEVDCRSPWRVFDLAPGAHTFGVRAVDSVGNEQEAPTEARWTVGSGSSEPGTPPPPPPPGVECPEGMLPSVGSGAIVAMAATPAGCFRPVVLRGGDIQFVSSGPVKVNGLPIRMRNGSVLQVRRGAGDLQLKFTGPTTLTIGRLEIPIPVGFDWTVGQSSTFAKFAIPAWEEILKKVQPEAFGMNVAAAPIFELSADNGGQAKIGVKLELPGLFRTLPTTGPQRFNDKLAGGLTTEVVVTTSNTTPPAYNVKQKLQKAWLFGAIELENVGWGIDSGPPLTFEGYGTVKIDDAELALALTLGDGGIAGTKLRKASILASKIDKHIGYGVHLQRAGLEFETGTNGKGEAVPVFTGSGGISFGPRIDLKPLFEGEAFSLDGKLKWTADTPWSIEGSGEAKIVEVPVAGMTMKYTSTGRVDVGGKVDLSIGGYGVFGEVRDGWSTRDDFSVDATGDIHLPGGFVRRADAVLSRAGMAVCYGPPDARIGWGVKWGGVVRPMVLSCDVGPFRRPAPAARAAAAERGFDVPADARLHVVSVTGDVAPPKVTLTGPGGERIETPAGAELLQRDDTLVVQDPDARTTTVALFAPRGGRWTLAEQPGSPAIRDLQVAEGLPPVALRGSVTGRRASAAHVLRWTLAPRAGQSVTFFDEGAHGIRSLLTTSRPRGRVTFRPGVGARRIVAVVSQDGVPRAERVLARVQGPAARPGRVRGLVLRGGAVRWKPQAAAERYAVAVARGGNVRSLTTKRPLIRVGRCRGRLRVSVVALGAGDRPGPRASTALRCRRP